MTPCPFHPGKKKRALPQQTLWLGVPQIKTQCSKASQQKAVTQQSSAGKDSIFHQKDILLAYRTVTSLCSCHLLQQDTQGAESMTALLKCLEGKSRRKEWSLQDEQCPNMPAGILDPLPCFSWLQFPSPTGFDSNPSLLIYSPPPEICLWIMQALHSPGFICQKVACGPWFAF